MGHDKLAGLSLFPFMRYKNSTYIPWPGMKKDAKGHLKLIKELKTRDDDILLCTAAKSGTHWVQEIISMLLNHSTEYNLSPAFPLESMRNFDILESHPKNRILHSHLPFSFMPSEHIQQGRKIVYVNRNPKDRHVSFYNFLTGMYGFPDWSWDDYFNKLVLNDTFNTGWFNYTKEWATAVENKSANIHQLMYEELVLDPIGQITRLAEFLGVPYDNDLIANIAERNAFHKLKDNKHEVSAKFRADRKSNLFRKGIIGDWKNWFTVVQNEQFNELYKSEMQGVNINFIYEPFLQSSL